jgi:uncharacterized integral membrane protein
LRAALLVIAAGVDLGLLALSVVAVYRSRRSVAVAWIGGLALFISLAVYAPAALLSVSPDATGWLSTLPLALPIVIVSGMLLALVRWPSRPLARGAIVVASLALVAQVLPWGFFAVG